MFMSDVMSILTRKTLGRFIANLNSATVYRYDPNKGCNGIKQNTKKGSGISIIKSFNYIT